MKQRAARVLFATLFIAQLPTGPVARYTAVADAVNNAGEKVRIDIVAWSEDADRDRMVAAWNLSPLPAGGARGAARGAAPRGGARGAPAATPPATTGEPQAAATTAAPPARGGAGATRGGAAAARGGRGGTTGEAPAGSAPASLLAALNTGNTAGILWTSENLGYTIRYAYRIPQPDGGERVILATERRLGGWNELWRPAAAATDYEFTVIELHLNAVGQGEGKASLTGKVSVDAAANTIALENYAELPVVFKNVTRQSSPQP